MKLIESKEIKSLLITYLLIVAIGISIGLIFLANSEQISPKGIVTNYNGDEVNEGMEIPEHYPKDISQMLITTHSHILGLAPIILSLSLIFFITQNKQKYKNFFMVEPLISLFVTFGSIWLVKFIDSRFVYLTILSGSMMYFSIFYMIIFSIKSLIKLKN